MRYTPWLRVPTFVLIASLLVAMLAACGGDDDDDATADASPTVVETAASVLEQAAAAWNKTNSAHFALAITGDAFLDNDESIRLVSAEGDIARPSLVEASAKIDVMVLTADIDLISADGQMYITGLVSDKWTKAPDDFSYDPSVLFSESDGIAAILTGLQDATFDGRESVEGKPAYKVTGTATAEQVDAVSAGSIIGSAIAVTVWVSTETQDVLRVTLAEPSDARATPATWDLSLGKHDEPVVIETPVIE